MVNQEHEFLLEMTGVSKEFPGVKALDKVNLKVRPHSIHALMGENGAGKSTLLKTMVGVLKPSSGQIDMWGQPHLMAPGMGFNRKLSGRENIILGGLAA